MPGRFQHRAGYSDLKIQLGYVSLHINILGGSSLPSLLCRVTFRQATRSSDCLTSSQSSPFEIVGLLVDRGFYNGASIQQLREAAPVVLPVIRCGKQMAEKLETSISYWTEYVMYEGRKRELRFPFAVCVSYQ